jgi:excisionase family DNA binding protein
LTFDKSKSKVMSEQAILKELTELKKLVISQGLFQKPILTFQEAASYIDLSPSYLYKLTCKGEIAFYKPRGKKIFMRRVDLENWLLRHRNKTSDELSQEAATRTVLKTK